MWIIPACKIYLYSRHVSYFKYILVTTTSVDVERSFSTPKSTRYSRITFFEFDNPSKSFVGRPLVLLTSAIYSRHRQFSYHNRLNVVRRPSQLTDGTSVLLRLVIEVPRRIQRPNRDDEAFLLIFGHSYYFIILNAGGGGYIPKIQHFFLNLLWFREKIFVLKISSFIRIKLI